MFDLHRQLHIEVHELEFFQHTKLIELMNTWQSTVIYGEWVVNCIILNTVLYNIISRPRISSVIKINDLFGRALGLIFLRISTASNSLPAPRSLVMMARAIAEIC